MAAGLTQYLRSWAMQINGERFIDNRDGHQFRCVFDIVVNPQNTLALADIQIYNLSNKTKIDQRSDIIFSAGYRENFDTLFIGTVTNILKERRGPDVVTRLLCRSGRYAGDRGEIMSSYMPGARLIDVLTDAARSWPLYLEIDESQFDDKDIFPTGYIACGDIPTVLDKLAYAFKFRWMQDRGSLVVTREDKERNTTVFEINQFTGMVGMPEANRGYQNIGVYVTTRINPSIRTTSRINVKSEFSTYNTSNLFIPEMAGDASTNGEYNVFSIHYIGDTHGEVWDMRIDAIRAVPREVAATQQEAEIVREPGTTPLPAVAISSGSGLIWGAKVSQEFRVKVREISENLGFDADWLMAVMAFETGRSFSPAKKNPRSSATGLIQFLSDTADRLGTSTRALANMTAVQQLDYVEKYFTPPNAQRIRSMSDCYMQVLWPRAVNMPDDYVLWTAGSKEYNANRELDKNHDGKITKAEAASRVYRMYKEGKSHMA